MLKENLFTGKLETMYLEYWEKNGPKRSSGRLDRATSSIWLYTTITYIMYDRGANHADSVGPSS